MNTRDNSSPADVTPALIAEAAAWISVLHGPRRTTEMERGFAQWLKTSVGHRRAFEEATQIWEESRAIARPLSLRRPPVDERSSTPLRNYLLPAAACLVLALVATWFLVSNPAVTTDIGEQRALTLDDGTRVILNTHSRIVVSYGRRQRQVELTEGEALFEVAKRPDWPFVVTVGEHQVRALGTEFAVRRDADRVAVTLVEGRVAVTSRTDENATAQATNLVPGERLTFLGGAAPRIDKPQVDKVLAWQRREVAFDNVALADAVAEMNRYSRVPLVALGGSMASIRVTGLFRAGDSLSFARAVADVFQLRVNEEQGRIVLTEVAGH